MAKKEQQDNSDHASDQSNKKETKFSKLSSALKKNLLRRKLVDKSKKEGSDK